MEPQTNNQTNEMRTWMWNLHGELIDHILERMCDRPDDMTCTFDHYLQACKLGNRYYQEVYPYMPDSPAITN